MKERVTRPCHSCGVMVSVVCPGPEAPDADCARAIPEDEWLCDACFAMREEARSDEWTCPDCGSEACEGCDPRDEEWCDCGDEFCDGECEL